MSEQNKTKEEPKKKLFNYVMSNPPYQEDKRKDSDNANFAAPVYHEYMDAVYGVSEVTEMITPARFLFNAGATPKKWNEQRLNDEHFKVLKYESDSKKVFPNVGIDGGTAVTIKDDRKEYGKIETFTASQELNSILSKVREYYDFTPFSNIVCSRGLYRFSDKIYQDYPVEMKKFTDSRVGASSFQRLPSLFTNSKPDDEHEYILVYGLSGTKRDYKWFRKDYIKEVSSINSFRVLVPAANGETFSNPIIAEPGLAHTETLLTIGGFDNAVFAENCLKYIKTKFARTMLGVLKVTKHNSPDKWRFVPLQDFTPQSDIDWSVPILEIDQQLYKKYGLDENEIEFIETHIKPMG